MLRAASIKCGEIWGKYFPLLSKYSPFPDSWHSSDKIIRWLGACGSAGAVGACGISLFWCQKFKYCHKGFIVFDFLVRKDTARDLKDYIFENSVTCWIHSLLAELVFSWWRRCVLFGRFWVNILILISHVYVFLSALFLESINFWIWMQLDIKFN